MKGYGIFPGYNSGFWLPMFGALPYGGLELGNELGQGLF